MKRTPIKTNVPEKKKVCDCEHPEYEPAENTEPFYRGDGTYFRFCKRCQVFVDVKKPESVK